MSRRDNKSLVKVYALKKMKDFIPIFVIFIGEIILFMFFVSLPGKYNLVPKLETSNAKYTQDVFISINLCILSITFIRFMQRLYQKPNKIRLVITLSLLFLLVSLIVKLMMNFFKFDTGLIDKYFYNLASFSILLSIYLLNLFGFDVLINPKIEAKVNVWKKILIILLIVMYGFYFMKRTIDIFELLNPNPVNSVVEILTFGIGFYSVFWLLLMMVNGITLYRKTEDRTIKKGLLSMSLAFSIFIVLFILFFINEMLNFLLIIETTIIIISVAGFYFVYMGFVKPAKRQMD
ncbi:MAG: hypothetical protein ACTSWN_07155 [Promethearchaeota archaeon]